RGVHASATPRPRGAARHGCVAGARLTLSSYPTPRAASPRSSTPGRTAAPPRVHSVPRRCPSTRAGAALSRSEEHTSELQSLRQLVCRLLLEKKKVVVFQAQHADVIPSTAPPGSQDLM